MCEIVLSKGCMRQPKQVKHCRCRLQPTGPQLSTAAMLFSASGSTCIATVTHQCRSGFLMWVLYAGLCHLGGWAMPRTPSSAAMTTSGRRWLSVRTVTWLSCSTGWTAAWRRLRGRASAWASSGGSWSSCCSAGPLPTYCPASKP